MTTYLVDMNNRELTDGFLHRANEKHGGKYSYPNLQYVNAHTDITVLCPIHGLFNQKPIHHLRGNGCTKCGDWVRGEKRRNTIESFLKSAITVHSDSYNYSKVVYKSAKTPVVIICPLHGEFNQQPQHHLNGSGCPSCGKYGYREDSPGFMYVLESLDGTVVKVGITNNFEQRLQQLKRSTPFRFRTRRVFEMPGPSGRPLEKYIHNLNQSAGFSGFSGATEWLLASGFSLSAVDDLLGRLAPAT